MKLQQTFFRHGPDHRDICGLLRLETLHLDDIKYRVPKTEVRGFQDHRVEMKRFLRRLIPQCFRLKVITMSTHYRGSWLSAMIVLVNREAGRPGRLVRVETGEVLDWVWDLTTGPEHDVKEWWEGVIDV